MQWDAILEELCVGPCPRSPEDIDELVQASKITAVVNLQSDLDFVSLGLDWPALEQRYRHRRVTVRRVPVEDFDHDQLRGRLAACVEAIAELIDRGHRVYVHCTAGINRSPSAVIAYLHWVRQWDLDWAVSYVRQCHPCDPDVEAILQAGADRRGESTALFPEGDAPG